MQQKQFQEISLQQYNPTSKTGKIPNKQSNLTPKQLEKEQTKPKACRRKETIKMRPEEKEIAEKEYNM